MARILEDLFFGQIRPSEIGIKRTASYDQAVKDILTSEDKLMELLQGYEKEMFQKFSNAHSVINGTENVAYFITGFKLGAKIGLEIMTDGSLK